MQSLCHQSPGHDRALLASIRQYHQHILDAVANQDAASAMQQLSSHIQASQRERLNEYDHWRRESALRSTLPSIFEIENMDPGL